MINPDRRISQKDAFSFKYHRPVRIPSRTASLTKNTQYAMKKEGRKKDIRKGLPIGCGQAEKRKSSHESMESEKHKHETGKKGIEFLHGDTLFSRRTKSKRPLWTRERNIRVS